MVTSPSACATRRLTSSTQSWPGSRYKRVLVAVRHRWSATQWQSTTTVAAVAAAATAAAGGKILLGLQKPAAAL